ncbi:uncharacterized protein BKA55DRAFT_592663 [Fusarium redolens]|uniref:Uncharacterized protein n=1 Tax=Fusarium redolens TaxID=48865 RepID=A0A9P9HES4_FUSRE|nr:uncharacterized protein BKA55DRAFT_592663 [Fusarium redolens]KAH7255307.1 hypothetical protein BKA55DRAFT_592663 [Fusarium redolens]
MFGYKPSRESSVIKAFKDSFHDLASLGKTRKDIRPFEWSLIRQVFWVGYWNLSVLGLLIYLCLLPLGFSDDESPCQPDGEFRFWAPKGFFQITLGWGRFSFGTAKLIDVVWDLVVGRGGQTVMALVSWRVFVEYLQLSLITKPATYSTVWLIRFQKDNSALATWKLASGFFKVGLASKEVMCFMIWTAFSMTGYTPYNKAYVNGTTGKLVQFSEIAPIAYVIRDRDRVDGLNEDYPVLWKGSKMIYQVHIQGRKLTDFLDSTVLSRSSSTELYDTCDEWEDVNNTQADCQLQRDVSQCMHSQVYVQFYGFEGKGGRETKHGQKTYFRNKTLDWPPLNIKAFYLPTPFYCNWKANFTDTPSSNPLNHYKDSSALTFLVEHEAYNVKEVRAEGICQPIKSGLFVMTILLHSWNIGLVVLWTTTDLTLKRNNVAASPEGWKGLLKMTDNIKEQMASVGIIWENLTEEELHNEIQLLLTGGGRIWKWMWKYKVHLLEGIFFIVCICLENTLRSDGLYYHFDKGLFWMAVVLYTIASLIMACALGSTYRQRLLTLLTAIGLSFPFLFEKSAALLLWLSRTIESAA